MTIRWARPGAALALLALIAAVYLGASYWLDAGLVDDAYIFLRYADNAARGDGLVFNTGERVEGFTSPLWVVCLTAVAAILPVDLPAAARVLSSLLGLATLAAMALLGARGRSPAGRLLPAAAALGLAAHPSFLYWTASGMETALVAFLVTMALLAPAGARWWLAAAALARPECLVLLPAWLAAGARRSRRPGWYLWFVAPQALFVLLLAGRYLYYGDLLPNTYHAKAGIPLGRLVASGASYAGQFLWAHFLWLAALAFIAVALARRRRALPEGVGLALGASVLWTAAVIVEGGDHFALFRFFVPVVPALAWAVAAMADGALGASRRGWPAAAALAGVLLAQNALIEVSEGAGKARDEVNLARCWAEVGRWLHAAAPPGASVASIVVGAIPYYSKLRTIDLLGLTDREVALHGGTYLDGAIGHQKHNTPYVLSLRPDYIIYRTSGWFTEPRYQSKLPVNMQYDYALYDLLRDPRTRRWYEYRAARLPNGRYAEFLALKAGAGE